MLYRQICSWEDFSHSRLHCLQLENEAKTHYFDKVQSQQKLSSPYNIYREWSHQGYSVLVLKKQKTMLAEINNRLSLSDYWYRRDHDKNIAIIITKEKVNKTAGYIYA